MRCSSTVVCLLAATFVVGLTGCHSTGAWNSPSWTTSSFNPGTWRMGPNPASSLALAPPAKPSLTSTPTYPNTADASKLASSNTPPKIEYPTTSAGYNSTAGASPSSALLPQQGRYGANDALAANPTGGFNNPVYETPAGAPTAVQNPYRATAPTVPGSNGSLASAAPYSIQANPNNSTASSTYPTTPYAGSSPAAYGDGSYGNSTQKAGVDSRYQAAIALRSGTAPASSYYNDPNSRSYSSQSTGGSASGAASSTQPYDYTGMPKVVNAYPSTSTGSPTISTGNTAVNGSTTDNRYPATSAAVNPATPANSWQQGSSLQQGNSWQQGNSYPVTSSATVTPPSASYQPGANGYQPGANQYYTPGNNGYAPGVNGYQVPASRATAPVQSGQSYDNNYGYSRSATGNSPQVAPLTPAAGSAVGSAAPFRPGSTGSVDDYPWTSGQQSTAPASVYPSTQSNYPAAQPTTPVKTSINTSNVMPVGFDQDAQLWR